MFRPHRGFSLIDVIVGTALMLVLFLALFGVLRASLEVSALAKAKATAVEIASTQIEYLRGLSYDALGTVNGIPAGTVPQIATSTVDGVPYVTHTYVEYYDDPADGTGVNDTNGVTTDYKIGKVTVTYSLSGLARSVVLVSNFVPIGIESTTGGGTLSIHVVNAVGANVNDASVQIVNDSTSPTINFTTFSDTSGFVMIGGAATSSMYQIYVSHAGYSSAQTYARTGQNVNPTPGYFTVSKDQTTPATFQIDTLATLTLSSFSAATTNTFSDTFANASNLISQTNTQVTGGALTLASEMLSGSARSISIAPSYLDGWGILSATISTSTDTTPFLGVATTFGILSSTYTNTALGTTIDGDLGYTTGPAVTPTVSGTTHVADGSYNQAGIDQGAALSVLQAQPCDFDFGSATDLSLLTQPLVPGVYCITGAASIGTGGITLSGSGTYLFRIDGALNTVANSSIAFANGASACDLFWTPTAATTLGANSTFAGTDIDTPGITIGSTVTWTGRALAFDGTVSTNTDTITVPTCAVTSTTAAFVPVDDASGNLLPDSVLPGNSVGFSSFPVSLTSIATSSYPALTLEADLTSDVTTTAPSILDWSLSYTKGPTPLPNIAFTLTGAKTIGTDGSGLSIYKTIVNDTTGGSATKTETLEWDAYTLDLGGTNLIESCPTTPYPLAPAQASSTALIVGALTANTLPLVIENTTGNAIAYAKVVLTKDGYAATVPTSGCGLAFFNGLASDTYNATVSATGYATTVFPNISVAGHTANTILTLP
jgi:type II secretory pathway pseudopilin PulG